MSIKITPLNMVSAMALVVAGLLLINHKAFIASANQWDSNLMIIFSLAIGFIAFLADQIFRNFVPSLVKIWVLQLIFIGLTIALTLLLKTLMFKI